MGYNRKLMEAITQCFAPSGCEYRLRELIAEELRAYADEMTVDPLGNLIVRKIGNGAKILLSAHMDQVGMMISYIDDRGYLHFCDDGGEDCDIYFGHRVIFQNGLQGIIYSSKEKGPRTIKDLYIDIGTSSREESEKLVSVGDFCIYDSNYYENGDYIFSRALDDRSGCYALVEAFKQLKETKYDVYFAFTVQEEVGTLGARTTGYRVEPDIGISVDVTDADDQPGGQGERSLGCGTVIGFKNKYTIFDPELAAMLEDTARKNQIKYVTEAGSIGGTDAREYQVTRGGAKAGSISIPNRYMHTGTEVISKSDVEETIKLITALLNS